MSVYDVLILQFIAHLLADYIFQSEQWVRHKRRFGISSKILGWHVLIVFCFSFILSNQWWFITPSVIIAVSHFLIDGFKDKIRLGKYRFFIDQTLHLSIITVVVVIFEKYSGITPIIQFSNKTHHLLMTAAYLFCTKPANILIGEILNYNKITIPRDRQNDLLNAGRLIGIIERLLTITLLLYNQFEAVGFLIAAKSILRYEGSKTAKTEYVLIGTMLSFGIAILAFVLISKTNF